MLNEGVGSIDNHIGVGSALLVQLYRAMREPLDVGRVTGTVSHAFFVSWFLELNITNTGKGSTGKNQNSMYFTTQHLSATINKHSTSTHTKFPRM